jgi:lipoprotein NlpI/Leu/Phe-tRNA-protein transferase
MKTFTSHDFFFEGMALYRAGQLDEAIAAYTKAIELNPKNAMVFSNRGNVYNYKGLWDMAIRDYDKAIELDPKNAVTFNNRGTVYSDKGLWDMAIRDYDKAIELDPKYAGSFSNRGNVYREKGLWDMAIRDHDKAIELDPKNAKAFNNRGIAYRDKGLWDMAIRDFDKAIELDPKYAMAFYNRGLTYRDKGLWDMAIRDFDKAIEFDPKDAMAFNNRGKLYHKKQFSDLALKDFTEAVKISFPGDDPRRLIRMIKQDEHERGIDFACGLMRQGFYVDILGDSKNSVVVKPFSQTNRGVLFFNNLHTGKTIRRHLARFGGRYELRFDTDFDAVFKRCVEKHNDTILTPDFLSYFKELKKGGGPVYPVSFSLYKDGKLAAGDVGVQIGGVYTSYSGYHDETSAGTVQIILTARYLEEKGFAFWDFGPTDRSTYKIGLGIKILSHEEYISIFHPAAEMPFKP